MLSTSTGMTPERMLRRRWPWALRLGFALLATLAMALVTACADDDDAGDGESPGAAVETAAEESTVDRLRANAAAFDYRPGKHGGVLTFATISDPLTFNLAIANDALSSGVLGYLFEGLTEVSWLTNEVEPALAESWENSADGLTWTFRLRRDVRWHDGTPFTAQDVDFTFNRIIYNDDIPASDRPAFTFRFLDEEGAWQAAEMSVETIDDYTVRFVLPVPFAPFLRFMGTAIYPKHLLEQAVQDGVFAETWGLDTNPAEIVGTGPFTIESYAPAARVVLKRDPNYWLTDDDGERLPYLDSIVQVIVPDIEAQLEAFRSGESDSYGVPGKEFAELEPLQEEGNFTIYRRGPAFGTTFLVFNMNPGVNPETGEPYVAPEKLAWFLNTEFRRAVSYAIDREAIIEKAFDGLGYRQWASISPAAGDFHNPEVRKYPHDADVARSILNSLGWRDEDGDGVREDEHGNPIEFLMVTNRENTVRAEVLALIHDDLEAIGIEADFELREFGEVVGQLTATYEWEAIVIGLTGGPEPHGGIGVWHSSEALHLWHPFQGTPATEWEAEIDRLYIQGSQELDGERRIEHYHRAQAIAAENAPLIYTVLPERLSAVRNLFGNTTPTLYGLWDIRYLYRLDQ